MKTLPFQSFRNPCRYFQRYRCIAIYIAHMPSKKPAHTCAYVAKRSRSKNHIPARITAQADQHGDYILRQRMLLLWGQLERRPILQPNRHSRATLRPAHERLAGQDRLIWQDDRSRLRLGEAVFWRDHSLRARQAHGCFLLVLAMPHKAVPTPWALQRGDHPQKLSLFYRSHYSLPTSTR